MHRYFTPGAQGINNTGSYAMQTTGTLISSAAGKFTAGMKNRKNNLQSADTGLMFPTGIPRSMIFLP